MEDNNSQDNIKKEYSADTDYNKTISAPNLDIQNTLKINMQSIDSINLNSMRNRNINRDKQLKEEINKNEEMPEISEIYGNKDNSDKKITSNTDTKQTSSNSFMINITKKIAPENLVAIITVILIIIFSILTVVLYNIFTN